MRLIACVHVGDRKADVYEWPDDPPGPMGRYGVFGPEYDRTNDAGYVELDDCAFVNDLTEALRLMEEWIRR